MKEKMKNVIFPIFILFIFIIVEIIDIFEVVPPLKWKKFENMSNTSMFAVVVTGFFCWGLPCRMSGKSNIGNIIGNIACSGIAFLMNIAVFGYTIQRGKILDSLWGWPLGWIIIIGIQILFLSKLAEGLLNLLNAIKIVLKVVGEQLGVFFHYIYNIIKNNKTMFLITFIGFLFWIGFLIIHIYIKGMAAVFGDTDIFWWSVCLWIAYSIVCILINVVWNTILKVKGIIKFMGIAKFLKNFKAIMYVIIAMALLAIFKIKFIVVFPLLVTIWLLWLVIGKKGNNIGSAGKQTHNFKKINLNDLLIVIIAMCFLPLLLLNLAAGLQPCNTQISMEETDGIYIFWYFIDMFGNIAKEFLKCFI